MYFFPPISGGLSPPFRALPLLFALSVFLNFCQVLYQPRYPSNIISMHTAEEEKRKEVETNHGEKRREQKKRSPMLKS